MPKISNTYKSTTDTAITEFIGKILVTRPRCSNGPTTEKGAKEGALLGSSVDAEIQNYVKGKAVLISQAKTARKCYTFRFMMAMRKMKIKREHFNADKLQLKVRDPQLGLSAKLDCVTELSPTHHHLIEVKTTQHDPKSYESIHREKCRNQPQLINNLDNTLENLRFLQLGFGMMCYRDMHPGVKVDGSVVVICRNEKYDPNYSVRVYTMTEEQKTVFLSRVTYNYDHSKINIGYQSAKTAKKTTIEWPTVDTEAYKDIAKLFKVDPSIDMYVKTKIYMEDAKYRIIKVSETHHVAAIIVNKESRMGQTPYKKTKSRKGHLEIARIIASSHEKTTSIKTTPYIVSLDNKVNKWRKEKVTHK